jgi:hypothetical protein
MKFVEKKLSIELTEPTPELGSEEVSWMRSEYPMSGIWTSYMGLTFDKK